MFKIQFKLLFLISFLLKSIPAKPTGEISFIKDINIIYDNDKWTCGDVECPSMTFGCKIRHSTDKEDNKMLNMVYTCFDKDKRSLLGAADTIEMSKHRIIDINVESYVGAVSVYSTGYGLGGHENAHGVIAPDDFDDFKKEAAKNKKSVDDSNSK